MDCREQDWAAEQRKNRIEMSQNQNRMEQADEELPRGGNPIATVAALILVIAATVACISLVLTFKEVIDGDRQKVSTRLDQSTIQLHEQAARLKP